MSLTGWIGDGLARWVRGVLRFRRTVIVVALGAAVLCAGYASTRLGINTDTTNMISDELPWRQDFIDFRRAFTARDRNLAVVVTADSGGRAEAFASALAGRLLEQPELFGSVFAAGAGEFFERNGLLYLSVEQLEALADRLTDAQPMIGQLRPEVDGARVVRLLGRSADGSAAAEPSDALHRELAEAVRAALAGERDPVDWRQLMTGGANADAGGRRVGGGGDAAAGDSAGDARDGEGDARRIVVLRPELDFDSLQPAGPAIERLRAIVDELSASRFPDVDTQLTGTVAMEHEEILNVRNAAGLAALASLALVAVVLYAALRSVRLIGIALLTLVAGLIGTGAFAAAAVGHLNLLSVAFAVLYVGLGVDFIIHLCLRVKELLRAGLARDEAIVGAVRGVGASLVICAVTTSAAFFAFVPTRFEGVSELGLISGTGMFISLAVSFTLLPALLGQLPPAADGATRRPWLGTRALTPLVSRPGSVLAGAAAVGAVCLVLLPAAQFDSNPVHLRDPSSESVRALQALAAEGEAPIYNLVAIAPDHETALAWAESLRELPTVREVTTVDALVPDRQQDKLFLLEDLELIMGPGFADLERAPPDPERLEHALVALERELGARGASGDAEAELRAALGELLDRLEALAPPERRQLLEALDADIVAALPTELERLQTGFGASSFGREALPAALIERWIDARGRELIEIAPRENVNDNDASRRFVSSVRSVVPNATGLPVAYQEASRTIVRAFQLALTYALALIGVLLWLFFRNVKDVLLVLGPILLAAVVTAGLTVPLGIPLNFANLIALPLLVGVGVDNGVHMVHRMRTEPPSKGGALSTSTSVAMLASALTTVASFGNLGFAAHAGMASMGQLLTLGMIVTLAATLLVLPAMLSFRRAR